MFCVVFAQLAYAESAADRASELVAGAIDLTRGMTSHTELTMTVHRPDWEKTSSLVAWTRGREDALIRFTAPDKDAGNATLKLAREMWTFTPKLNRVVRLPASMMSQSWAGSDFSYNDLSRSDELLVHYTLTLVSEQTEDEHVIYTIDAVPHADAPVVWGKERLRLRDDLVLMEVTYFDQDLLPLKRMTALQVGDLGGRTFATRMRMEDLEESGHYTELAYKTAAFDIPIDDRMFTQFALRNAQ
ncbi:MAG: outer membrane lipoprotein-sorting protein [Pseudomonadales bacterium]